MHRTQHPSNTRVLGAPAGWDQKEVPCGALPITETTVEGVPAIVSYWQPSREELARLNAGKSVALWIVGTGMPPVAVEVDA